jgi:hypothetical protein
MPIDASIILDSGSFLKKNSNLWYDSWRVGYFQCDMSCPDVRIYADGEEVDAFKLGNGKGVIDVVHLSANGKGNVGIKKSNKIVEHLLKREVLYEVETEVALDETEFDFILHFHAGDFRCSMVKKRRFKEVDGDGKPTSDPIKDKVLGPIAHDVIAYFRLEDGDQLRFEKAGAEIWSSRSVNARSRLEIEILADDSTACKYYQKPFGSRACYWMPNQGQPPPTSDPP